jgi:hypothetical protein
VNDDAAGRCSLCDRPVLGLAGHDWSVLPWMLDDGDAGVLPGPAHCRCLHDRGIARIWAEAVESYHCTRWPRWLAGVGDGVRWRLHHSPRARRFHLWRTDGILSSFPYAAIRPDPPLLVTELAEVGSGTAAALLAAMGTGEAGVEVPLDRVIDRLGLTDRYPAVQGSIARRRRHVGTAARPERIDLVIARHPLRLDAGCRRAAHALMRATV